MKAGRDPVDRVIDLVIAVPVSIMAAARQLLPVGVTRLERRIAHDLDVVVRFARRSKPAASSDASSVAATIVSTAALVGDGDAALVRAPAGELSGGDAPVARASTDQLPIEGYDQLSARQIVDRLGALTGPELALIDQYEQAHRRRQTILLRIAQLR